MKLNMQCCSAHLFFILSYSQLFKYAVEQDNCVDVSCLTCAKSLVVSLLLFSIGCGALASAQKVLLPRS